MSSTGRGPAPNVGLSASKRDLPQTSSAPEDHRFHDSSDCSHGAMIQHDADPPRADYPRRCNWCTEHDRPTPS
jgi:hypothetical protein